MILLKNLQIRTKITLVFTWLIAIISVFIYLYFPGKLEELEKQKLIDKAQITSKITAFSISLSLHLKDKNNAKESIKAAFRNDDLVYILVKDTTGEIFIDQNFNKAILYKYSSLDSEFSTNIEVYKISEQILYNHRMIGQIYLGFSISKLNTTLKATRIDIAIVSVFVFLLGIISVYMLSSHITGPLKNLVQIVKKISDGDLSIRMKIKSTDEIGQLESSFNTMVNNLENAYIDLESINRELEDRVIERTDLLQQEINEHKRTVEKLFNSETKTRALLNAIPDLIFVFSKDGYFLEYKSDKQEDFYVSPEKFIGKHVSEVLPANIAEQTILKIHKTISTRKPQLWEYELEINGKIRLYESRFVLRGQDEVLSIVRDITEKKKAENALIESEAKFSALTETIPSSIFIFSNTNFIYLNPEVELATGYSKTELLNMNFWDIVHPDYKDLVMQRGLARQNGEEVTSRYEFPIIKKNKEVRWIDFTGKLINYKGKVSVLGIAIDITNRIESNLQLRKLSRAVEQSSASIIITDVHGNIEYVNPKFSSLTGYSYDEVINKNPKILKSGIKTGEEYSNLWATIKAGKEWRGEFLNKKKNGELYWESASISCIKDQKGETTHFLAVKEDITEQKLVEEKLIQSEKDYHGLFENSNDAILIFNPETQKIIDANSRACRLFSKSLDEFENTGFAEIASETEFDKSILLKVQNNFSLKNFEIVHKKKNGAVLYLELNATNIYYRGKKAILVIFRDVTERKNFEEELLAAKGAAERSDQLKSEFLAQISHEIRTPINTILSYSSLLKEELIDKVPDDLKQSFSIIDEGSRRLIRTIDLILSMSQIQTGNFELNILEIDIFKNVLETLQLEFINQAKTKGIELNLISDTTDTKIPVDCFSVVQIFSNLIDNAIKFTKRGKVEIKIYQDIENRLCVDVQDTGVGISADFIPRLFTPFSQEEGGYTRSFEGNGLGLALVKKYAEFNNAKVSVTSDKGKGTTFTVAFKRMNIV